MSEKTRFSIREQMRFTFLGVKVKDNTVYKINPFYGDQTEVLGPLAGTYAVLSQGANQRRWHLSVIFADGRAYSRDDIHPRQLMATRHQVAEFNETAAAAAAND